MTPLRDAAESATAGVPVAPERIWATINGASTRLPDGVRQFIGGWSEDQTRPRAVEYVKASAIDTARAEIERLRERLGTLHSFVSVMIGRGPNCIIPEEVASPLGIPLRIGALMREIDATLSPAVKEPM